MSQINGIINGRFVAIGMVRERRRRCDYPEISGVVVEKKATSQPAAVATQPMVKTTSPAITRRHQPSKPGSWLGRAFRPLFSPMTALFRTQGR